MTSIAWNCTKINLRNSYYWKLHSAVLIKRNRYLCHAVFPQFFDSQISSSIALNHAKIIYFMLIIRRSISLCENSLIEDSAMLFIFQNFKHARHILSSSEIIRNLMYEIFIIRMLRIYAVSSFCICIVTNFTAKLRSVTGKKCSSH